MTKPPHAKVNKEMLFRLLNQGKTVKECAKYFGVSPSAISQQKKLLTCDVTRQVSTKAASQIVSENLDMVTQLGDINRAAHRIVDDLSGNPELEDRQVVLKACAEVRKQLGLQLEILKSLHDFEAVAAFQEEVLTAIAEEAPHVRDKIVSRIQARRSIRDTVRFTR